MKIFLGLIVLGCLVVGAFYLGYTSETPEDEKAYAKEFMNEHSMRSAKSIGAYENH